MELNPQEMAELAEFFARRFPAREDPAALAGELRLAVGNRPTWQEVVEAAHAKGRLRELARAAHAKGRLRELARAAARRRPDDDNLRALEATLKAPARRGGGAVVLGAAAVLIVGGALWVLRGQGTAEAPSPAASPVAAPAASVPVAEPVAPAPAAPVAEPATPLATASVPAVPPPVEAPPPVTPPPEPQAPVASGASTAGRCGGPTGSLVGYWYAGSKAPAEQGATLTLSSGANVRTDYPRRDNRWKYNFPVVCSLQAGDRLTFSHAPIRVDGGDYWVPLYAGDLAP